MVTGRCAREGSTREGRQQEACAGTDLQTPMRHSNPGSRDRIPSTLAQVRELSEASLQDILFVTLDSCRYDTFLAADAPNLKAIGPLHRAHSPSHFTYGAHAAFFAGFTPGIAGRAEPFVNPKFAKIFKMQEGGFPGHSDAYLSLQGRNVVDGLKNKGYRAIGSGAVGWFNDATPTGKALTADFDAFFFAGNSFSLRRQLAWIDAQMAGTVGPKFVFINIGETHVPYYHEDAPWDPAHNPCQPFSNTNDAQTCRARQRACLEFVDRELAPLLTRFDNGTVVVCADHGDCWGEDGLWEHGIHHEKTLEVPLLFRLAQPGQARGMGMPGRSRP